MDWFLSVTTLLSNSGLGWARGAWWMWLIHAVNAIFWIVYAIMIKQYGLIFLSVVTILIDFISGLKDYKKKKKDKEKQNV